VMAVEESARRPGRDLGLDRRIAVGHGDSGILREKALPGGSTDSRGSAGDDGDLARDASGRAVSHATCCRQFLHAWAGSPSLASETRPASAVRQGFIERLYKNGQAR